jgi:hypothetical protein
LAFAQLVPCAPPVFLAVSDGILEEVHDISLPGAQRMDIPSRFLKLPLGPADIVLLEDLN